MELKLVRFKEGLLCPYCQEREIVLWGKRKNIQRYRCKSCRKLFNDLTGTPMARTKLLEKWPKMAVALQQSMTLHQTAEYVGISVDTAFRWRHRLLAGLREARSRIELTGVVEIDETFFRYSEKGSRRLLRKPRKRGSGNRLRGRSKAQVYAVIAKSRTGGTRSFLLRQMSGRSLLAEAGTAISPGSVLCSDSWRSYRSFARQRGLKHVSLNMSKGQRVVHGIYHIQGVNSYHSRLKIWIGRFHGVATKYLLNYLVWHEYLDESRRLHYTLSAQEMFSMALGTTPLLRAA